MSSDTVMMVSPDTRRALQLSAERYEKYARTLAKILESKLHAWARTELAAISFCSQDCALCKLHYGSATLAGLCAACPVKRKTGQGGCQGTSYYFDVDGALVDFFPPDELGETISLEVLRRALWRALLGPRVEHASASTTPEIWWAAFAEFLGHVKAEAEFLRKLLEEVKEDQPS